MKRLILPPRWRRTWREDLQPLLLLALGICAGRSSLADWNDVPTGSMKPTILEGDRVWVNKLAYDLKAPFTTWPLAEWGGPTRGDIVVFRSPADEKRLVKRVVGLPGDTVAMTDNHLFINGQSVAYEAMENAVIDQSSAGDPPPHLVATEHLDARKHPVMVTPRINSIRSFGPVRVPAGHYWVMGDNRDNSFDSRYFGFVERRRILGRATAVVASLDRNHHYAPRWERFFTALP
ncbi:MAG: signal peptidase I [Verrucomicrobia bacterium]|nr:signal peptidase I [Verrucomicrobiota bacterium]